MCRDGMKNGNSLPYCSSTVIVTIDDSVTEIVGANRYSKN